MCRTTPLNQYTKIMSHKFEDNGNFRSSLSADLQRHIFVCCVPKADVTKVRLNRFKYHITNGHGLFA